MKRILFQGDSITDCGRSKTDDSFKGNGYAAMVMGHLNCTYPGEYEVLNRAISGNRIVDLYARIKADIINLAPDVLSIHIGVNDVWHEVSAHNGVDEAKFEMIYDMLLKEVKTALPNVKIMLLGAYVLNSEATKESWQYFSSEVEKRANVAKKLAEKYGCVYVDLQSEFDTAISKKAEPYWTREGVHPTEAGHELIKRAWLGAFENAIMEKK